VIPAMPKRIPAAQFASPPAWITSATKIGMIASRATVSAFGSCASGAETALVAI
jgi:hypothetical protein